MQRIISVMLILAAGYILLACKKQPGAAAVQPQVGLVNYKTYLALGDSYTIGQSVTAAERFPLQTVSLLKQDSINFNAPEYIAVTGWTTRNLLNGINTTLSEK